MLRKKVSQICTKCLVFLAVISILNGCNPQIEEASNVNEPLGLKTLFENDFVLYYINCGANQTADESDTLGLYQSVGDQEYDKDPETGVVWGYRPKAYMQAEGDTKSSNRNDSKWVIIEDVEYISDETGFYYDCFVPLGEYEVICGFYDPFSARTVDILAETEKVVEKEKILKYELTEAAFTTKVTDGELNIQVYNPNRGKDAMKNPILSYIIVRVVPEYNKELLALLLEERAQPVLLQGNYTEDSFLSFIQAKEEAEGILKIEGLEEIAIKQAYLALEKALEGLVEIETYEAFSPGEVWTDTEGNRIQAHGGQVQRLTVKNEVTGEMEDVWWWIGEDKTLGYRGGICAYSSRDLYNWNYEGVVMRNISTREQLDNEEYFTTLYKDYTKEQLDNVYECINDQASVIERPKMIYNEKTEQYVIWFHADGPLSLGGSNYEAAAAGVAVSESPAGPFRFIDRYRLNTCPPGQEDMHPESKGMARDMNLFVDDDGSAYIIYSSEENLTIYISRLNEEYTYLDVAPEEAVYGKDFIRLYPGAQREAPAIFKRNGIYYMMTSGATGWRPNQARYWMADTIFGTWEDKGDPCIGDDKRTTFDSQSTCIFNVDEDKETYIYMGDRWNEDDLSDSRYVWLPVKFNEENEMTISWIDEWGWEDINKK